jgi:hypothetical protein
VMNKRFKLRRFEIRISGPGDGKRANALWQWPLNPRSSGSVRLKSGGLPRAAVAYL